ncbi:MAG TPA: ABC transporter substrate-binding protein [Acidimicrobiales bacterium]
MRSSTRRTVLWALALVTALALVAFAYLRDDSPADDVVSSPTGPTVPDDPGTGCGKAAVTDPADLRIGRPVARCAADSPAARPLSPPAALRVAVSEPSEGSAPLRVAEATGAFAAEGLTVDIVDMSQRDAYDAMARGEVDVVVGGVDGPFLDAVRRGSGARLVLGGALARAPEDTSVAQGGLWVRRDALPDMDDWSTLRGQAVAVNGGLGSSALYPIRTVLGEEELSPASVDVVPASPADAAEQLANGDVNLAWLPEPEAATAAGHDNLMLVATLPAGESIEGTVFAPRLLAADRAVGLAYVRAIVRTINTHLADGYDDEALDAMSADLDVPAARLADDSPPVFDWELRAGTTDRIQGALVDVGGIGYEQPLPETALVDRSLYGDVVAAG